MPNNPDEGDILLFIAKEEIAIATRLRNQARKDDDYYVEQASVHLLGFHEAELEMLKHYIDMKRHAPTVATALEEHKPYLLDLWVHASQLKASLPRGEMDPPLPDENV